jgi:hypothetical protein
VSSAGGTRAGIVEYFPPKEIDGIRLIKGDEVGPDPGQNTAVGQAIETLSFTSSTNVVVGR